MAKASIEEQLAAVKELRDASAANRTQTLERLRPFLKQQNNLVVARAADLVRDLDARELLPELISAFERFLKAPAKSDPQCWAKNALSKVLHQLGCDRSTLFIEGMRLHQFEPVWGGQSDVAGTLRANCAHALIDCQEITHHALLLHLLELVADQDRAVRAETMRAIAEAGGESAALLLRLRALTACDGEEAEVIGQCYAGILSLEGVAAVPFIAQFLTLSYERSAEAALALGETRTEEALAALLACLQSPDLPEERARSRFRSADLPLEPEFAGVLLSSIALTRRPEAIETLLDFVATESDYAEDAIEALGNENFGAEVKQRLAEIVDKSDNSRIRRTFTRHFPG
jgi:hypothetical protein